MPLPRTFVDVTLRLQRTKWLMALALVVGMGPTAASQTYRALYRFDGIHGCNPSYPGLIAQGRDGNLYGTTPSCAAGFGTAFKITAGGTITQLFEFDWTHGAYPFGGLTLARDGNFYGAAQQGGRNGYGTIFRLRPDGLLTTIHDFTGADGASPNAPPVQGTDGNFYGTTGTGTAYKVTSAGVFTPLGPIPGGSTAPLFGGSDGNFYGTTATGGSFDAGTVFKISPTDVVSVVYNFDGSNGSAPYAPLVDGSDGNYYGTTLSGGTFNAGVVFKVTPNGVLTVLQNFDFNHPEGGTLSTAGLIVGSDGNFYGVTAGGGTQGEGAFFEMTSAGVYAVLYSFSRRTGSGPYATLMQHTNAKINGLTNTGGRVVSDGVVYSMDLGLPRFVKLVTAAGRVGMKIGILGNGLNSTTSVRFNGTPAKFTISSGTFLTANVPPGVTTGPVTVTVGATTLTSNTKFRVIP